MIELQQFMNFADLTSTTKVVLVLMLYIGPFFFIPAMLQRAGGMLASITGAMNNRSKGIFDRARNWRANKRKQLKEDAQMGNRFGNNPLARKLRANDLAYYTSNFSARNAGIGISPKSWDPRSMKKNLDATVGSTQTLENAKKLLQTQEGQAAFADEAVSMAAVGWKSDADVRAKLEAYSREKFKAAWDKNPANANKNDEEFEKAQAAFTAKDVDLNFALLKRARRMAGDKVFDAAAVVSAAGTSSGHSFEYREVAKGKYEKVETKGLGEGEDATKENATKTMVSNINQVAGNDDMLRARLINEARGAASKAGRTDLSGGSFGTTVNIANSMQHGTLSGEDASKALLQNVFDGTHVQTAAYGKKDGLRLFIAGIEAEINAPGASEEQVAKGLAKLAALHDMSSTATADNAAQIAKALSKTLGNTGESIQASIEKRMRNPKDFPAFYELRRDIAPGHGHFTGETTTTTTAAEQDAARKGTPTGPGDVGTVPTTPGGPK